MFVGTGKPRKLEARAAARELRRNGASYKKIAAELDVSPSSAFHWTRDIELTQEQIDFNQGRGIKADSELVNRRARTWVKRNRDRRAAAQGEGRRRALEGNALHEAGCMLYWAEGAKDKNQLAFANSDVHMVCFFADFLRKTLKVADEDLIVRLNVYLHDGLSLVDIEQHWLDALDLPRSCLRTHQLNHFPTSSSGRKRNLPFGVCTLKVKRSTSIVQHIYGAIQEYGGFDEPKWLG